MQSADYDGTFCTYLWNFFCLETILTYIKKTLKNGMMEDKDKTEHIVGKAIK